MANTMCFNVDEVCPDSREYLHHKKVKTVRCGRCGLLNPQHPSFKAPAYPLSSSAIEITDDEDSPASKPPPPPVNASTTTTTSSSSCQTSEYGEYADSQCARL